MEHFQIKSSLKYGIYLLAGSVAFPALAAPFSSIYQMALQLDPTVAGAQVQITATQERVDQAQGALQSKWNFTDEEKRSEQWQRWQDGQRNTKLRTRQYGLQYSYPVYRPAADDTLAQSTNYSLKRHGN